MKTYIITLLVLLLSLPVLAKGETPIGLFQVDSSHSHVILADDIQDLSGFIVIKKEFPDSKFSLESGDKSFESTKVTGDISDFVVTGLLYENGKSKEITLKGSYFGVIDKEVGYEKLVMKLENDNVVTRVFATQPKAAATSLHQMVREIVR